MPSQTSLFQVYLRLRPPAANSAQDPNEDQWLIVEPPAEVPDQYQDQVSAAMSTHITLQPPNNSRKRAVERFGFTKVFHEEASQLDIFEETGTIHTLESLLREGRDGLVATLGVTGSGKSHTILGSQNQRGLTQMTLDVLFRSIGPNIRRVEHPDLPTDINLLHSVQVCDPSEAHITSASTFLESVYGNLDRGRHSRAQTPLIAGGSRAQTPMTVWHPVHTLSEAFPISSVASRKICQVSYPKLPGPNLDSNIPFVSDHVGAVYPTVRLLPRTPLVSPSKPSFLPSQMQFWNRSPSMKKTVTKKKSAKDSLLPPSYPRRNLPTRPSALPQLPDLTHYHVDVDRQTDYVVLISMYEVYNDRIFDLLSSPTQPAGSQMTTRQGAALQKGLLRRPLLFKSTEMSPDRKVVAGLRKVVCGCYDEAMMVLETGLIERRVAGTGSNSVSSRSHGFFCIEVKQSRANSQYSSYDWDGGTMSIVDLAGSERARNAKTTGSTLAEAGKINESLMYLGQCLQVQSDCQQDGSKPIVPFRQCKLTELLFSNSFAAPPSHHTPSHRTSQRAVMIVTADPHGDFNATSQILRYSALAREVTVPRIPSVTSTIFNGALYGRQQGGPPSGRSTPNAQFSAEDLEVAASEIVRLTEECDQLAMRLVEEEIRRTEADLKLQAAEEKASSMEQAVREECWAEMEATMEEEKARWRAAWDEERARGEDFLDGKIELLEKGTTFEIRQDVVAIDASRAEELEHENASLRARFDALERELHQRSPTKRSKKPLILQENANPNPSTNPFLASLRCSLDQEETMAAKVEGLSLAEMSPRKASLRGALMQGESPRKVSVPKTPGTGKKQRKLGTTRKWDFGDLGSEGDC